MQRRQLLSIVEVGLAVALAAALNVVVLFEMPQGGSVSLDMAPIMLIALRRGAKTGVFAGFLYGFVNLWMRPYVFHPAQVVLDYPLAFALVGLAGLFAGRWRKAVERGTAGGIVTGQATAILPGALLGAAARGVSHIVSGVVFFASYAPAGQHPLVYSVVYNLSYLVPSAALAAVVLWITMPVLERAVPLSGGAGRAA